MKSIGALLILALVSAAPAQECGELGRLWTFDDPPLEYLREHRAFTPDEAWLEALRLGSLRVDGEEGGSASFVSPHGLILTSTRCVRRAVTATRRRDLEIINAGFFAVEQEDEFRLRSRHDEWLTASQLVRVTDVTDEVRTGTDTQMILDAAVKADPEFVPEIVKLYDGAVVQLYQYKVYDDLRLVVLPHVQVAQFGGESDNFSYPRYCLDFAFVRAYENGVPVDASEHFFAWKPGGATEDELVFVSGSPRATSRFLTKSQMELERDVAIPIEIERIANALVISTDRRGNAFVGDFDPENPSAHWAWVRTGILRDENLLRAARGNLAGLEDEVVMTRKAAAEQAFKDRVMSDDTLAARYGDLWRRIADIVERRREHDVRSRFQTPDAAAVLGVAVAAVRMSNPDETDERRALARATYERWAGAEISPNYYFIAACMDHVERSRNWLAQDDPYLTRVLRGMSAEAFNDALAGAPRGSADWFGYAEARERLVRAGWKAIQASDDPAVMAARELVPLMRENERVGKALDATEEALRIELARALFACYGTNVSADATSSPRFSDGVVRGYPTNDTIVPYRTTFFGLFGRNAEFGDAYPFNLPMIWLAQRDEIDMTKPVNFVSTNDVAIGSAGSVVVNADLEVVGVVVDGNAESLHNDFVFTDDAARAVSTHVDGIIEALEKVYGADRVVEELVGR